MYLDAALGIFQPVQSSSLTTILINVVDPNEVNFQDQFLTDLCHQIGKVVAFQSIATLLGLLCSGQIHSVVFLATYADAPNTVYLISAGVMVLVLVLTLSVYLQLSR